MRAVLSLSIFFVTYKDSGSRQSAALVRLKYPQRIQGGARRNTDAHEPSRASA